MAVIARRLQLKPSNQELHVSIKINIFPFLISEEIQQLISLRLNILCCVYRKVMLWKMLCFTLQFIWAMQTINFLYTQHAMFKHTWIQLYFAVFIHEKQDSLL